jgi:putative transposase
MSKSTVIELSGRDESRDPLTEMLRVGAQQLIQQAFEAELQDLLAQYAQLRTAAGTAGVVRSGYQPERDLQNSLGPVAVKIPKVRSKTGKPVTCRQKVRPGRSYKRRSKKPFSKWQPNIKKKILSLRPPCRGLDDELPAIFK